MINTNSLSILGQFYFKIKESFKSIYQNSNFYEKKISKTFDNSFEYKPSPHLLSSIIRYQNKKYKIEDFAIESFWQNNLSSKDYEKLNNFFSSFIFLRFLILSKTSGINFCPPNPGYTLIIKTKSI